MGYRSEQKNFDEYLLLHLSINQNLPRLNNQKCGTGLAVVHIYSARYCQKAIKVFYNFIYIYFKTGSHCVALVDLELAM